MKFCMEVMALKTPYFSIQLHQPFQNMTFKLLRWVLLLNRLVDLDEMLFEDDDIEDYLDSILIP
jgi:hypothetical protein